MNNIINVLKKHNKLLLTLIYFIVFIIYAVEPINFDVKIYIEAAQRADLIGKFPINIIQAWEHKYILNRLLFYVICKIVKIFVNTSNFILFEAFIKVIYGILSICIIKCFSKSTKSFFEKYKISETTVFSILYFVIMASGIYFSLQTEMTAFLIMLISIIFVLKDNIVCKLISAFIISMLFWLKGVTLLFSVIVLVFMILDKQEKPVIIFTICWSFSFLILELIGLYKLIPIELTNMYLATQYITESTTNINVIECIILNMFFYKFFYIGIIMFFINIVHHIKEKNYKLLFLETSVWFILFIGVYIQKMVYFYQMGLMIPSILLSFFIFLNYIKNRIINNYIKTIITIFFAIILIINIITEIYFDIEVHKENYNSIESLKVLEQQVPDLKSDKILYIGNGLSSYYIKGQPYIGYTTTIFLANDNKDYLTSEHIQQLKEQIKRFNGKYIIIDEVEFFTKFRISDDIIKFIKENYHYKQSTGIGIYEMESDIHSVIYEKN